MSTLVNNKKIRRDYEVMQEYEAGIALLGLEVKSLKSGRGNLEGAYVIIRGDEAFLVKASIPPFQAANTPASYEEDRNRKLLFHKKEIAELLQAEGKKGLTIVPLSLYNKGRSVKVQIAIVRHKNKADKRQVLKKLDDRREIERSLKNQ